MRQEIGTDKSQKTIKLLPTESLWCAVTLVILLGLLISLIAQISSSHKIFKGNLILQCLLYMAVDAYFLNRSLLLGRIGALQILRSPEAYISKKRTNIQSFSLYVTAHEESAEINPLPLIGLRMRVQNLFFGHSILYDGASLYRSTYYSLCANDENSLGNFSFTSPYPIVSKTWLRRHVPSSEDSPSLTEISKFFNDPPF